MPALDNSGADSPRSLLDSADYSIQPKQKEKKREKAGNACCRICTPGTHSPSVSLWRERGRDGHPDCKAWDELKSLSGNRCLFVLFPFNPPTSAFSPWNDLPLTNNADLAVGLPRFEEVYLALSLQTTDAAVPSPYPHNSAALLQPRCWYFS